MADESQDTLARLRERLSRLEQERQRILIAIQVISGESDLGNGSTVGGPDEASADTAASPVIPSPSVRRPEVRPDSYFGLSQHQAARRYLQGLGHADRLENILRSIVAGGVEVGGANPLGTLRATMGQNTSVFVRVSPGTYGLREFYPQLGNRGEKARTGRIPKKPAKSANKRVPRAQKTKKDAPTAETA